jgi:hypothetical protein
MIWLSSPKVTSSFSFCWLKSTEMNFVALKSYESKTRRFFMAASTPV